MNIATIRAALCAAALALSSQALSDELKLPKDGWASWQVAAMPDSPATCCWSGGDKHWSAPASCCLDDERFGFGTRDHAKTDAIRVYARMAGGKVERLQVFAANCLVEAAIPIQNLGTVDTEDSARWLVSLSRSGMGTKEDSRDNVLGALAMHRSDLAQETLVSIARSEAPTSVRKNAVLWLAVVRGVPGADVVSSVMFSDRDANMREHAAFALAQSGSPRVTQDLIRLGNTDKSGEVRGQAWFWLAQTAAAGSEAAINAALRNDQDDDVREKAVFALSQLPDERATAALVAVAEDRSLSNEQRKRAVFWLAQSDAQGAQKYLEKVLAGNRTD